MRSGRSGIAAQAWRIAVELLLERIDGRQEQRIHLTEPTLVVRRTSGSPR
jgi:DNA-binding LacI/PurR family transcriptional regulator